MSYTLKQINDVKIVRPKIGSGVVDWKGKNIFDIRYWVLAALGKRKSGKSTLIYTLLKNFVTPNTIVLFFCPTFYKDDTYQSIRKYLKHKGIGFHAYTELVTDGVNNVQVFMDANNGEEEEKLAQAQEKEQKEAELSQKSKSKKEIISLPHAGVCKFECEKKENGKIVEPKPVEYIIVFDDMSDSLRDKYVIKLTKNSRHFKSRIIISTQSVTDLHPMLFHQLDYLALFHKFNEDSLEKIYDRIEPGVSLEEFINIYETVTKQKPKNGMLNFLLINRADEEFRVNLNKKILLN